MEVFLHFVRRLLQLGDEVRGWSGGGWSEGDGVRGWSEGDGVGGWSEGDGVRGMEWGDGVGG